MQRDLSYVADIVQAARLAQAGVATTKKKFLDDWMRQAAVARQFEIIGEATKRISTGFRTKHPQVPWRSMAGMRDMLIHEYDSVDYEEVWQTARRDIPQVIALLEPLIPSQE